VRVRAGRALTAVPLRPKALSVPIKAESLTMRNFTCDEVADLHGQHTAETDQVFLPEAVDAAFHLTQGQPWLVNALAINIKLWCPGEADPVEEGLRQLDGYLAGLGLTTGWRMIFDRRPEAEPIEARTRFEEAQTPRGYAVTVLRA